jgi:hypothetical protein
MPNAGLVLRNLPITGWRELQANDFVGYCMFLDVLDLVCVGGVTTTLFAVGSPDWRPLRTRANAFIPVVGAAFGASVGVGGQIGQLERAD